MTNTATTAVSRATFRNILGLSLSAVTTIPQCRGGSSRPATPVQTLERPLLETHRSVPLDLPTTRRYFSADEFVRLMQNHFFYFHVSNVWFNVALLRELGGFPLDVKWHGDLLAAYAAAFELGAVYTPDAVSYVRISPMSYGAAGSRSSAQLAVLRAWLRTTKRPGSAGVRPSPRPRSGPTIVCRRSASCGRTLATSRFDCQGGSFGYRSGPGWHRSSAPAFVVGFAPPEHNTVVGCGTRIEVAAVTRAGALVARDGRLEGGWTFRFSRHRECSAAQARRAQGVRSSSGGRATSRTSTFRAVGTRRPRAAISVCCSISPRRQPADNRRTVGRVALRSDSALELGPSLGHYHAEALAW